MQWITRERTKIDRFACPWLIESYCLAPRSMPSPVHAAAYNPAVPIRVPSKRNRRPIPPTSHAADACIGSLSSELWFGMRLAQHRRMRPPRQHWIVLRPNILALRSN